MATFKITGQDGASYRIEAPDEQAAMAAFQRFQGGDKDAAPAAEPDAPVGLNDIVRATATGVPLVGGLLNKANAATNAFVAPLIEPFLAKGEDTLDQPTFGERYNRSLEIQNKRDEKFAKESPIVDTTAKIAGGIAGTLPMVLAAPRVFGAIGTLPEMVRKGAMSGAALSGADAAIRGEDVPTAAVIGGGAGAAAPLVARAIGKGVQAMRPQPAPVPHATERVGNVEVPLRPDQVTGDVVAAQEAQTTLRGGAGDRAQGVAQTFDDLQNQRLQEASAEIAAKLDPSGTVARTAPQEAGDRVVSELIDAEARRFGTESAARARATAEATQVRGGLGGQVDPAGNPVVLADSPYAAGESVGAGVAARRDAAVADRNARYAAVRDEPGSFDPQMVAGMSQDVRARIAAGDDPLHVDPQVASKGNEALRVMDSLGGTGLFHNAAAAPVGPRAPVGPVAEAAVAPASEAERALADLVAQGVNPARARAAVADLPGGDRLSAGALAPHEVATPAGGTVQVVPKVVEASSIRTSADAGYDPALQPRNRARAASDVQINDIARNLNPARLGVSSEADRGAPIIGADGMVESGNGRVLAVRQAYQQGGEPAARYREWLQSQGVDVSKYREPILVRERATPMSADERKAFTVAANQSSTLSLSASERALADSRLLTPETLTLIRNPADLAAADNRDFVRAFMQGVPASERGALMTASGELSSEGLARMRNAVLAKAYGDTPVLARIAESATDDVKSISNGLVAASPEWALLRTRVAAGDVPAGMDITGDLIDAVSRTARIRGRGVSLAESQAQADAFAQQSEASSALQRMFYGADGRSAAPASQIGNALRHYAQEAVKVDAAPGLGLGLAPVTAADVLKTTAAKVGAPAALAREVQEAATAAATATAAAPAASGPPITEVGLREMDAARKRLVSLYSDARSTAIRTGDRSDVRATARILHEFDNALIDAFENGRFSGDSARAAQLLREARASHSAYRQTFTSRGGDDEVGRSVEKILGRYADTAASPDEIARLSYGAAADPGGGKAARVAQRLREILGPTSPEWGAYKQGLFSYLTDPPPGTTRTATQTADRIDKFLTGSNGRTLAQIALSADERAALGRYAANLRASEPAEIGSNVVDRTIARWSGRDGGQPATPGVIVDALFSRSGRGDKNTSVALAQRLKRDLSPEGWTSVRQGMWEKLTNAGEGKIAFGPQALAQRLHEFLNEGGSGLAKVMFTSAERDQMATLAKVYRQMVPPKGTVPVGSAPMLAKIANKATNNLMAMLGAAHSGFGGMAIGWGAEKALRGVADARNARKAVQTFYGPQRAIPARSSRAPIVLSQGVAPQVGDQ